MDEPLIYTVRGNLPVSSLEYATRWEDAPEYIKLVETYRLEGEVVRESAHVYVKQGLPMFSETGKLGGAPDWRALLGKYITIVGRCEGVDFLETYSDGMGITGPEFAALNAVALEVRNG